MCSDDGGYRLRDRATCAAGVLGMTAGPNVGNRVGNPCPSTNGAWPTEGCFSWANQLYYGECARDGTGNNGNTFDSSNAGAPHNGICFRCVDAPTTTAAPTTAAPTAAPTTAAPTANVLTCPCTNTAERLTLKTPQYSNLGGIGPDTGSPEAVLYPEAGIIQGKAVNVKLWTEDAYKGKSKMNGVKGTLGRLNMKTSQEVTFKVAILDASTDEVVPLSSDLPVTFLDLDEGKNAKGRGSLTVCNSKQFAPDDSELSFSMKDGCNSASSTTPGTAKDNPDSVEGALSDAVASKRVVSYTVSAGDDGAYSFTVGVGAGHGFRNFLFTLTPGAACTNRDNLPEGCAAALEAEG